MKKPSPSVPIPHSIKTHLHSSPTFKPPSVSGGSGGIDAIVDGVTGLLHNGDLIDTLDLQGLKLIAEVVAGPSAQESLPQDKLQGVHFERCGGYEMMAVEGDWALGLENLLQEGKYKVPLKVDVTGQGVRGLSGALQKLKAGVSGTKVVVSL